MKFEKDIVFFDLETTSADVNTAKIVQIALIKIHNGERQFYKSLVNPLMPIPQEAIDVHGITNEMVANEKPFYQIAEDVVAFIGDADLAGYNIIRFDIPVLIEELARTGRIFLIDARRLIDLYKIYIALRPRNLAACYKEFTGRELDNAHDAMVDTYATFEIFEGMLSSYSIPEDLTEIEAIGFNRNEFVDLAGCFVKRDNEIYFNFGKHKGQLVRNNLSYLSWMVGASFSADTRNWANKLLKSEDSGLPF